MQIRDGGRKLEADIVEINHIYRFPKPFDFGFKFAWGVLSAIGTMIVVARILFWILDLFGLGGVKL